MKKRVLFLSLFMMGSMVLTGCNEVISLSDEETTMIAEYAAEMLLKYDVNYEDRITDGNKEIAKQSGGKTTEETVSEPATEVPEEESTTEASPGGNRVNSSIDTANEAADNGKTTGTESNIARIAGIDGVDITYKDYDVVDHYPAADEEGEFISLDASEGYQLLVLRFRISNATEQEVAVSLMDKEIAYHIVCNGTYGADPMLTILMDDLGTLETTVQPGQEEEAVLVFQIADSMKDSLSSIQLKVNYNNVDNVINILNETGGR